MVFLIDDFIQIIHKEIERYRDAKKEEKEKVRMSLQEIAIVLENSIIDFEGAKRNDRLFDCDKIKNALPNHCKSIKEIAIKLRQFISPDLCKQLNYIASDLMELYKK